MHRFSFLPNNCLEILSCYYLAYRIITIHFTNLVLNENYETFMAFFHFCPTVYNNHSIFLVVIWTQTTQCWPFSWSRESIVESTYDIVPFFLLIEHKTRISIHIFFSNNLSKKPSCNADMYLCTIFCNLPASCIITGQIHCRWDELRISPDFCKLAITFVLINIKLNQVWTANPWHIGPACFHHTITVRSKYIPYCYFSTSG